MESSEMSIDWEFIQNELSETEHKKLDNYLREKI